MELILRSCRHPAAVTFKSGAVNQRAGLAAVVSSSSSSLSSSGRRLVFRPLSASNPSDLGGRAAAGSSAGVLLLRPFSTAALAGGGKGRLASAMVDRSPARIRPYLQLMRVDKPAGTMLLFWPCGWSTALAAAPGTLPDPQLLALFGVGALMMRGAGCTVNDMWDSDIDRRVARTQSRPITSGQVGHADALVFLTGQLGLSLLVLLQFNWCSVLLGASSLGLVVAYPLFKRFTYWPQLMLGLTFNWGALMGWPATHGTLGLEVTLPLYAASVCWTLVYDTIYAHQDKKDDVAVGIKSTALRFGDNSKAWLGSFTAIMIPGLVAAGVACNQTLPYYLSVGAAAGLVGRQVWTLKVDDAEDCGKKFNSNSTVGLILFLGAVLGTLCKDRQDGLGVSGGNNILLPASAPTSMVVAAGPM